MMENNLSAWCIDGAGKSNLTFEELSADKIKEKLKILDW